VPSKIFGVHAGHRGTNVRPVPKFIKVLLRIVIGLVLVVLALGIWVAIQSNRKLGHLYSVTVAPPAISYSTGQTANGHRLAETHGCTTCHGKDLGGAVVMHDGAMGLVAGSNLTSGLGGLPANFSDLDFVKAIRHGLAPNGRGLYLMPSTDFATLTESDLADIVAYIRSVPPVDRPSIPIDLGPVARALVATGKLQLAADQIDHDAVRPDDVKPGPTVAYGRYLAVGCTGCHGPKLSGGKIEIGPPSWPHAANLTAAGELSHWTEADFVKALRAKIRPDGSKIDPVMPAVMGEMNDMELQALWAFLQTLPAVPTGTR
jgi:cytochrome c553